MKLFAALERALLARWRKIKYALKLERWPLLNLKEQRLQLKKQYLESLFRKKWQKFERSIYVVYRTGLPHWQSQYNTASETQRESWIAWVQLQQGRTGHARPMCLAICWRSSLYQSRISLRLTIMCDACDSNNTVWDCSNLNTISVWTAIIST